MKSQPKSEAEPPDTPLLSTERQGEEWNRSFGACQDEEEGHPSGEHPPNHGLIELLLACPYPFEIPPRQKDFSRPIDLS